MSFRMFAAIVALITLLGTVATGAVAFHDEAVGRATLGTISPLVESANSLGSKLYSRGVALLYLVDACVSVPLLLLLLIELGKARKISDKAKLHTALLLAAQGQMCLLTDHISLGSALYIAALATIVPVALAPTSAPQSAEDACRSDLLLYSVPFVLLLFTRFYSLNRVHPYFEGELSPYMLGATNGRGFLLANAGAGGPWAPLGYLYYLPIYLSTKIFGTTLLAVRVSSVLVNVLTFFLAFLLSFKGAGRWAAFFTGFLMALESLQIGWGRTDIHPHGATSWVAILMCWLLLNTTRDLRYFSSGFYWWPIAALMALSWHQYPSGQTAVFIPVVFTGSLLLLKQITFRQAVLPLAAILIGGSLWALGGPLTFYLAGVPRGFFDYFAMLGPRLFHVSDAQDLTDSLMTHGLHVLHSLYMVIHGVFISLLCTFHQDILQEIPGIPLRSVNWSVAVLSVLALFWFVKERFTYYQLSLWSWLVCALIPGIFSEAPYPKRCSNVFVALILISSVSFSRFVHPLSHQCRIFIISVVCVLFGGWSVVTSHQWFGSGGTYGVSIEEQVATVLRDAIKGPHVILISCSQADGYCAGKFAFLLSFLNDPSDNSSSRYFLPPSSHPKRLVEAKRVAAASHGMTAWCSSWGGVVLKNIEASWSEAKYIGYVVEHETEGELRAFTEQVRLIYPSASIFPVTSKHLVRGYTVVVVEKPPVAE